MVVFVFISDDNSVNTESSFYIFKLFIFEFLFYMNFQSSGLRIFFANFQTILDFICRKKEIVEDNRLFQKIQNFDSGLLVLCFKFERLLQKLLQFSWNRTTIGNR